MKNKLIISSAFLWDRLFLLGKKNQIIPEQLLMKQLRQHKLL